MDDLCLKYIVDSLEEGVELSKVLECRVDKVTQVRQNPLLRQNYR